ncbi:MAG: GntR family transcriptional regulator [Chitinivibrionales bacterium]|nr:GntR family transcriptional regulator [Chitinivibrionales bacterium]
MSIPPGILKAMHFLSEQIGADARGRNNVLPGIRILAASAGVSYNTMNKALIELKRRGILDGVRGSKYRVVKTDFDLPEPGPPSRPPSPARSWVSVASKLRTTILGGGCGPHEQLPSRKILCNRFGVGLPTLTSALGKLESEGLLERKGRSYRVAPLTGTHGYGRIMVIGVRQFESRLLRHMSLGLHAGAFVQQLEEQCVQSAIGLDVVTYDFKVDRTLNFTRNYSQKSYQLKDEENVLGYIFIVNHKWSIHPELLQRLAALKKPVAVLDMTGSIDPAGELSNKPHVQLFSMTLSAKPAYHIARYLLGLHHRALAFFSPYQQAPWSQQRLAGLRLAYTEAGLDTGVREFVMHYAKGDASPHQYEEQRATVQDCIRGNFGHLDAYLRKDFDALLNQFCSHTMHQARIRLLMKTHFESALAQKNLTVWVAVNDQTACMALEYLDMMGVDVPGEISVISFDDSPDALLYGLTSFNFNIRGLVRTMLRYIMQIDYYRGRHNKPIIEIKGTIIERLTVAPQMK